MKSFGDLMKQAQKMQRQMTEAEEKLADTRYEASAGGGMVKAVVDGRGRVKEIKIDPKALEEKDISLLEDLMITAVGPRSQEAPEQANRSAGHRTASVQHPP